MRQRREFQALRSLTLLLAVVLARPAWAGEMLLYGPGVPSPETAARAEAVLRAATDVDAPSGGTSHVLDLPFPSGGAVWTSGDLLPLPCGDRTLGAVDPRAVVAEGTALVDDLSYDKALLRLAEGLRALPCVEAELDRKTLTDLYFFMGLAEFEEGSKKKAKRAFASALAIDIDRPWDDDYPPDPQALYEEAAAELRAEGAPSVGLDLRGGSVTEFRIDGETVDLGTPQALELHRGKHLTQYTDADGNRTSSLVNVGRDGGDFVTRDALRHGVLNLAWKPVTAGAAEAALSDLGRSRGVDEVYVVLLGEGDSADRAYRFTVSTADLLPLVIDQDAVAAEMSGRERPTPLPKAPETLSSEADIAAGRLGITLGGGLHVGNLHPYGLVTLRAHVRLVGGLELGGGLYLGVTAIEYAAPGTDSGGQLIDAVYVLPGGHFDVRYRVNLGSAHPYFGGRGIITASEIETSEAAARGFEDEVGVAGGGGALVGIDITPAGPKGLILNIDFTGGYWKLAGEGGGLLLDIGAGIGVRF
jgi:hypothetical protein